MLFENDTLKYRFQPSKKLESSIIQAFEEGIDPIAEKAEKAVTGTLLKTYKDLM